MDNSRLSHIELFAFDTNPSFTDRFVVPGSLYLLLRLTCGEQTCYGECVISPDGHQFDVTKWGVYLRCIHHSTAQESWKTLRLHEEEWTPGQVALLQSALSGMDEASDYAALLPSSRLFAESVAYYSVLS